MTRCYCIFEGGGAKGIAHIGALRALEDAKLDFAGFAGTSAGAIVAALAAAGYSSRELMSVATILRFGHPAARRSANVTGLALRFRRIFKESA